MVEAGEAAGILDQVLDRVAFQIEKDTQIKRRVKGAMMYPTMVMIFATLVLVGLLMFLVPVFVNIFGQLGGKLPTLTQYVVNASNVLRSYWFIIFPLVGLTVWGVRRFKRTEQGRQLWDRTKLKIPMKIGDVVLKVTMARFSRTLSTLVAAGVDIIKALEITGQTAGNWVVEEALAGVRSKVHQGVPIGLRRQPLPVPALARARVMAAVVQPVLPVLPKLDRVRPQPEATPVRRSRHLPPVVFALELGIAPLELLAALQWLALLRRP